jgi:hypothetical protein
VRFGLGGCNELLVDLPNYTYSLNPGSPSGFSDISPALKHQIGPLPGDIDLAATIGIAVPTGNPAVCGLGYQLYLQFPWSHELGGGWGSAECSPRSGIRTTRCTMGSCSRPS